MIPNVSNLRHSDAVQSLKNSESSRSNAYENNSVIFILLLRSIVMLRRADLYTYIKVSEESSAPIISALF